MFYSVLSAVNIDVSQVIGLCVFVISVLSWFINIIKGNTPEGAPRPNPQKPKPPAARSEIEVLLEQVAGDRQKPIRREQQPQSPRPPKPQQQRPTNVARSTSPRPGMQPAKTAVKQPARISETHLASSNLGSEVRSHHIGNRVDAAVQKEITAAVHHDLGNRIAAAQPPQEQSIHPLVKVLRDPNGIRQAILLNEILQRPKARRNV